MSKPFTTLSENYAPKKVRQLETALKELAPGGTEDMAALLLKFLDSKIGQDVLKTLQGSSKEYESVVTPKQTEIRKQFEENASLLMKQFPGEYALYRKPILKFLTNKIPIKYCADLFGVSASTVSAARALSEIDLDRSLLFVKQVCEMRHRISEYELSTFKKFLEEKCKTPSG